MNMNYVTKYELTIITVYTTGISYIDLYYLGYPILQTTGCFISDVCYGAGEKHPDNKCFDCQPSMSTLSWTQVTGEYTVCLISCQSSDYGCTHTAVLPGCIVIAFLVMSDHETQTHQIFGLVSSLQV